MTQNPTIQAGMPPLGDIRSQRYKSVSVRLDGNRFTRCTFEACVLRYAGGPADLVECVIGPGCVYAMENAAAFVPHVLRQLGWKVEAPADVSQTEPS